MKLWRGARRYPWVTATLIVGTIALLSVSLGASTLGHWLAGGYALAVAGWQSIGMIRSLARGAFGLDVLAVTAIVATVLVGDVWASLMVVLMLTGGEALEDYAEARARRELSELLARSPQQAHVILADGSLRDVPVDQISVGDALLVKPGETVPVDAILEDEEGLFDESSLTGESLPAARVKGELVLSGSVNGQAAVRVQAQALARDSQYQQIVALVQAASDSRAPFVRLADRYAVPFTAVAFVIAGIAWWLSGEPSRFAEVLVVATPCPLLIAAPVAFIGGMSRAAKNGVIVKSGGTLEQLSRVRTAAFDKTGTLTHGKPEVERVVVFAPAATSRPGTAHPREIDETQLLRMSAAAEAFSPHVLAHAIVNAADNILVASEATEDPGHGVMAHVDGARVAVGKKEFVVSHSNEFEGVPLEAGQMSVYVAIDGVPAGQIILRDLLRENAQSTLAQLRKLGVEHTVMLTGDAQQTAEHIAASLEMTDVRAGLLPADKVAAVSDLRVRPVMMVGDGVNDAPVLASADVGVAMGARGATAASESADVVIMVDDLERTVRAISIAQRTVRVAKQSIWMGISISVGLMFIAAFGFIPAIIGATLQEAVDLLTILNGLRAVRAPWGQRAHKN